MKENFPFLLVIVPSTILFLYTLKIETFVYSISLLLFASTILPDIVPFVSVLVHVDPDEASVFCPNNNIGDINKTVKIIFLYIYYLVYFAIVPK